MHKGELRKAYKLYVGIPEGRRPLRKPRRNGRIVPQKQEIS
jgi:hypothetical protein